MSIRTRLLLVLMPTILFFVSALIYFSFHYSEEVILTEINKEAYGLASTYAKKIDILFETSEAVAQGISLAISSMKTLDGDEIKQLIRLNLKEHPEIYGSTVSFKSKATILKNFSPYFFRKNKALEYLSLNSVYDYQQQQWFINPLIKAKGLWGKPYFDQGAGNVLMMTYSEPVRYKDNFIGVATVDISLDKLLSRIKALRVGDTGFAFIVTKAGRFIAHPQEKIISDETIYEKIKKFHNKNLLTLSQLIDSPEAEFSEIYDPFYNVKSWVITTKFDSNEGTLVIIYPQDEILKPLINLKIKVIWISIFIIALIMLIISYLSSSLTSPLTRLVEQADYFSMGHFERKLVENKGLGEIKQLSRAFNRLGISLLDYIEKIKKTTAEKERYVQELRIAADIQQGILPHKIPPFNDLQKYIDLFGVAQPAREVGGDFYDFFRISETRIGFVIADVSDKGAASALFMAMTRALIREIALYVSTPAEVLRRANQILAENNSSSMFVTLLYGDYDLANGNIYFSCAGHNPPLHISSGGEIREIPQHKSLPLGALENTHYKTTVFSFSKDETLLLYTDGLTEANNGKGEMYGIKRVVKSLYSILDTSSNRIEMTSSEISQHILSQVNTFQAEIEQFDDITILVLKDIHSKENKIPCGVDYSQKITLEFPAQLNILAHLLISIKSIASDLGFTEKEVKKIQLAVEEVVTNIITHTYHKNARETFKVRIFPAKDKLQIVIIDYGKPFPFEQKAYAYSGKATIEQKEGGIGLFLVRKLMDEVSYEANTLQGNKLTIIKYLH